MQPPRNLHAISQRSPRCSRAQPSVQCGARRCFTSAPLPPPARVARRPPDPHGRGQRALPSHGGTLGIPTCQAARWTSFGCAPLATYPHYRPLAAAPPLPASSSCVGRAGHGDGHALAPAGRACRAPAAAAARPLTPLRSGLGLEMGWRRCACESRCLRRVVRARSLFDSCYQSGSEFEHEIREVRFFTPRERRVGIRYSVLGNLSKLDG